MLDLITLFDDDTGPLEQFIGARLVAAGLWHSARTSDGIASVRVLERGPAIVRLCGHMYTIDQTLHAFWLELVPEGGACSVRWTLYFGIDEPSARRRRDAILVHDHPEDLDWNVTLSGTAVVRDGSLISNE